MKHFKDLYTLKVAREFGDVSFKCNICGKIHTMFLKENTLSISKKCIGSLLEKIRDKIDGKYKFLLIDGCLLAIDLNEILTTVEEINRKRIKGDYKGIMVGWC